MILGLTASDAGTGIAIALTGMLIVFTALGMISLFIKLLPQLLTALQGVLPAEVKRPPAPADSSSSNDEAAVVAALAFVLHTEFQKQISKP